MSYFFYFQRHYLQKLSKKIKQDFYNMKYIDNYDGDTIYFEIFTSKNRNEEITLKKKIRLNGVDTKEMKGKNKKNKKKAKLAKNFIKDKLLKAKQIDLLSCKIEKYGRMLCDINVDNKDLSTLLIKNNFGIKYTGRKRI